MKPAANCRDVLVMALASEDQPFPVLAYRGGNRLRKLARIGVFRIDETMSDRVADRVPSCDWRSNSPRHFPKRDLAIDGAPGPFDELRERHQIHVRAVSARDADQIHLHARIGKFVDVRSGRKRNAGERKWRVEPQISGVPRVSLRVYGCCHHQNKDPSAERRLCRPAIPHKQLLPSERVASTAAAVQPVSGPGRSQEAGPLCEYGRGTPVGLDVSADGQRFLLLRNVASTDKPVTEMHVVLNWTEELKRLAPAK
jgi:hypothetical protein